MHKSFRFWIVLLLGLAQLSFLPEISDFFYRQKSYPDRIQYVRQHFQKGMVLPLFALEEDYNYRQALDEISNLGILQ